MSGSSESSGDVLCGISDNTVGKESDGIQIIAYYDEFTLTNPLGSKSRKYKIGIPITIHT